MTALVQHELYRYCMERRRRWVHMGGPPTSPYYCTCRSTGSIASRTVPSRPVRSPTQAEPVEALSCLLTVLSICSASVSYLLACRLNRLPYPVSGIICSAPLLVLVPAFIY